MEGKGETWEGQESMMAEGNTRKGGRQTFLSRRENL